METFCTYCKWEGSSEELTRDAREIPTFCPECGVEIKNGIKAYENDRT